MNSRSAGLNPPNPVWLLAEGQARAQLISFTSITFPTTETDILVGIIGRCRYGARVAAAEYMSLQSALLSVANTRTLMFAY